MMVSIGNSLQPWWEVGRRAQACSQQLLSGSVSHDVGCATACCLNDKERLRRWGLSSLSHDVLEFWAIHPTAAQTVTGPIFMPASGRRRLRLSVLGA